VSDLLNRNVLVIEQKPKFVELTNEYRILDDDGNEIGVIRQEGQSKARKLMRLVTSVDQFLTHRLSVYDSAGGKVLEIVRPAKVLKSTPPDPRRPRQATGADRPAKRRRKEALLARGRRGRRPWVDRRGELAFLGLRDPRPGRCRGRADHEAMGGDPA
jgi:hypothetical protein